MTQIRDLFDLPDAHPAAPAPAPAAAPAAVAPATSASAPVPTATAAAVAAPPAATAAGSCGEAAVPAETQPAGDAEALARALEAHPDYRVLRRLVPRTDFGVQPQGPLVRVALLDTETTGLDQASEAIIELALVLVDVDSATGRAVRVVDTLDAFEDPGRPISEAIAALTGITDDMVRGQRIDDARVHAMLEGVSLVIAHNAKFDRPFVEARLPVFAQLPWACSFADIDWKAEGRGAAKLEWLAMEIGLFFDAHRAETDCHALLAVLHAPLPTDPGATGLGRLLAAARAPRFRVFATGSPFETKDALKARGYRWDGNQRVWYTDLAGGEAALDEECAWLKAEVYGGRAARIAVETQDARVRFSGRPGQPGQRTL